ncbi:MAG TPA: sugar ABC transporter permease [Thermomicrobiales bacterium]|nr:sugar ABC transporter permease [Thermomicrobiales bacterium]
MAGLPYAEGIETASIRPRRIGVSRYTLRQYLVAYLFIAPVLLLYIVFVLRPTLQTFWLAFYEWNGISADRLWVGLANFQRLVHDAIFWQALQHSLVWTAVLVAFNLVIGLIAAALLAGPIRGRLLFRLAYFLPVVQASIVTAMIWRWIYAPTGVLNTALQTVGLGFLAHGWLGDFNLALPALAVASSWMTFGLSVVILLAGMQGIDPTLYDAARVDGAGYLRTFLDITIPSLRNTITIVILLALVDAFKVFDIIWATTQGGPIRSTEVLATYLFKEGFQKSQYGYGSAIAVALALIILASSVLNITLRERGDV